MSISQHQAQSRQHSALNQPRQSVVRQTSFIGRESELNRVGDLLRTTRLLTLVGPGGVGKTRLALEVTRRLVDAPEVGETYVAQLADVSDPEVVPQAVAEVLGIRQQLRR